MHAVSNDEEKLLAARMEMVAKQLHRRGIHHAGVLEAFAQVPREKFIPHARRAEAYADQPVPIGLGQTISQPYVTALMVQELDPAPSHRILDVGMGSGYQAAILSQLVAHVYGIERLGELTEQAISALAAINVSNVTVCTGDGSVGWPEEAPFDGIICGAAAPDIPQPWLGQLRDGGRIIAPVGGVDFQRIVLVERRGNKFRRRELCDVRFVKLIGKEAWSET